MIENTFAAQAQTELQLSYLYLLNDLLSVMQQNLNLLLAGDEGQTINLSFGNLFALAAQYYGDATEWTAIANSNFNTIKDANGFISPNIVSVTQLIIPPAPTTPSGGVLIV